MALRKAPSAKDGVKNTQRLWMENGCSVVVPDICLIASDALLDKGLQAK